MDCFLTCIERSPDFAQVPNQIARLHANAGRLNEARHWAQLSIALDPLMSEAHFTLALIHQEQGATKEALKQLKKTLYLEPEFIMAHISMANLYQQLGRQAEADRHHRIAARQAAKVPPEDLCPGSDGLTAGRLLTMAEAILKARIQETD